MAGRDYTHVFFRSARKTVSNGKKARKPWGCSIFKTLGRALFHILHRRLPEHRAVAPMHKSKMISRIILTPLGGLLP
jgi:hypothetical protein